MHKTADKEQIVKIFKYLVGQAEEGNIASLTAIGRWVRINPNRNISNKA